MYSQRPNTNSNYRGNSERPWRGRGEYRGRGGNRGSSNSYYSQRGDRGGNQYRGYNSGGRYRDYNNNHNQNHNNDWEQPREYDGDAVDDGTDDVITLTLTDDQMVIYEAKKIYVRDNLSVKLDDDDIARICHQCDFNE